MASWAARPTTLRPRDERNRNDSSETDGILAFWAGFSVCIDIALAATIDVYYDSNHMIVVLLLLLLLLLAIDGARLIIVK